jgi:nitroreductase
MELDMTQQDPTKQDFNPLVTPYELYEHEFPYEGPLEEQFEFLLRYVVLAPSGHNTQPWLFSITDEGVAVYADYSRRLPVIDPDHRELIMSIGAAIFNLRVAAEYFGFSCRVNYNHANQSESPIAFVALSRPASVRDVRNGYRDLLQYIPKRHTNRNPFLMARIPKRVLDDLEAAADDSLAAISISTDPSLNQQVANLVAAADRMQHADPQYRNELAEWIRTNWTRRPDGIRGASLGLDNLPAAVAPWIAKTLDLGKVQASKDKNLCLEAPGLIVIRGEDSVPSWLEAGELLQKLLLTIVRNGLQYSFFNNPVQVPELRLQLRQVIGAHDWPQLLLRVGYCLVEPPPTPRKPLEEVLVKQFNNR